MQKKFLFLILGIFLISFVSATIICNPSFITTSYQQGQSINLTTYCSNDGNSSVAISKIGSYFSIDQDIIGAGGTVPTSKTIKISFDSNAPSGFNSGSINFDNGYSVSVVSFVEAEEQQSPACGLDIFPTSLSNIKIQQGETKTRNILLTVPNCYPSSIEVNGVILATDEKPITLGELQLGNLQPGNSLVIPILIDAVNVATGQYSDLLDFQLYNSSGTRVMTSKVSVSVLVTTGIQPISNFSLADLPSCSLSAINLALNATAKITCTKNNPNIDIKPIIDKKYIKGINVIPGSSQYVYEFQPIKIGSSLIGVEFLYQNAPMGSGWEQEIFITSLGSSTSTNQLDISFYQEDIKKALSELLPGETSILVKGVELQNLITDFTAYLNGKIINTSFILEANKPYELIVNSAFVSKTINFTINPQYITISLNPSSGWVEGSFIYYNVTENASLFLDGIKLTTNNFVPSAGNHTLEAILDGYINTKLNITVLESVRIITPILEWKKGVQQSMLLSKSASWQINYAKDLASQYNPISSGVGTNISFTPEKSGLYQVIADGKVVDSKEIKGRDWGKKWWFMAWYWWLLLITAIIIVVILLYRRNSGGVGSGVGEGGFAYKMEGVGGGE